MVFCIVGVEQVQCGAEDAALWDSSRDRVERGCEAIDGGLEPSIAQVILELCEESPRKTVARSFVQKARMRNLVKGACNINCEDPS